MTREPHIADELNAPFGSPKLQISDQPAFINWTILHKFIANDMGLSDESDLRRAVEWAAEEIKVLAVKVKQSEKLAASLKVQLEDETDRPLREALVALGWTPPGEDE